MRRLPLLLLVAGLVILALLATSQAPVSAGTMQQVTNPWRDLPASARPSGQAQIQAPNGRWLALNSAAMQNQLALAPAEDLAEGSAAGQVDASILLLPMPQGDMQRFRVVESPVMAPELAAKYPSIKTYVAQGVDDPTATARLDFTPHGFHAAILSTHNIVYIDPAYKDNSEVYISYNVDDQVANPANRLPELPPLTLDTSHLDAALGAAPAASIGTQLRTYRLAVAADGEYTQYHGGTVEKGLAAVVTAVNRVDGVYEQELAIRMVLVPNNNLLIYTNPATDPYTNDDAYALLDENQANLDSVIGSTKYDIGHVFSTYGGGLAGLGVVCDSYQKAAGETGMPAPDTDYFWIDYVAHEMGHQFGGNHTFNSKAGSCGGGNRNANTSMEPGSGSTIMAYAGICGADDLQPHSDPFFHSASFDEIISYTQSGYGNTCAVTTATGNRAPVIGSYSTGYNIPLNTPFTLTGAATDPDGDALTYQWEQMNKGAGTGGPPPGVSGAVMPPHFRSWSPTTNPSRTFPRWSDLLANTTTIGEGLPNVAYTLSFRFVARDNRLGGGGVSNATSTITAVASTGPFKVTSPNTAVTINGGVPTAVTWDVANTGAGTTINCTNVKMDLSTDGGATFSTTVVESTANDGSENVIFPSISTTQARLRIACVGNIFFDISNTNFTVKLAPGVRLESSATTSVALPGEQVTYLLTLINNSGSNLSNLTVTDTLPLGVTYMSATSGCIQVAGVVTCPISSLANGATTTRSITVQLKNTASGPQVNTAVVSGLFTDPYLDDNTTVFTLYKGVQQLWLPLVRK